MRIGFGYDSHRLIKGRKFILGGLEIPHEKGLYGHSDGDVLCHAIIDSIIGALGLGDMGKYFPDTDQQWKNASSIDLLLKTLGLMKKKGFEILWIDTTVIAEKPKLEPYINTMKSNLSKIGISENVINIKAKTNEGMGFIGKGEGIAAHAVCLLKPE
ncbi:MAG: 2-C-methyl-D-erythritol 2,4-cyclodiphosphate synthase [Thermodesulfovibrionia bacterium]|nr:2-C-methyl-D-erythritol 2,4-cyclodiphosphate synthase [Thermodesulfovibrionia bacterium]